MEKKLDALKDKLFRLKGEEIKTAATKFILDDIVDKSLIPLFNNIIDQMKNLENLFFSINYHWSGGNNFSDISKLSKEWKYEGEPNGAFENFFTYRLNGFKKSGTEAFNTGFQLNYRIDTYWYGFTLVNHNNQQPFIKKLYHEQLTSKEIEYITDTAYNNVLDDIERQVEYIKQKKE